MHELRENDVIVDDEDIAMILRALCVWQTTHAEIHKGRIHHQSYSRLHLL